MSIGAVVLTQGRRPAELAAAVADVDRRIEGANTYFAAEVLPEVDAALAEQRKQEDEAAGDTGEDGRVRAARLEEGSVLGEECVVEEEAYLSSGVKVYPFKTIEAGAVVNTSVIWESRGQRTLFGPRGVCGLVNVEITPELVVRLASAYATETAALIPGLVDLATPESMAAAVSSRLADPCRTWRGEAVPEHVGLAAVAAALRRVAEEAGR